MKCAAGVTGMGICVDMAAWVSISTGCLCMSLCATDLLPEFEGVFGMTVTIENTYFIF